MTSQTKSLVGVLHQLSHESADLPELARQLKTILPRGLANQNEDNLVSFFSEQHVRSSLEKLCAGLGNRVVFDPIRPGRATEHYRFAHRKRNLVVKTKDGMPYSEIDELLLFDHTPVLFEVKLGAPNSGHNPLAHAMRPARINHVLAPIREYFRTDVCEYVLIVSRENINVHSASQRGLREYGGRLVPFYTTREKFKEEFLKVKDGLF